MIRFKRKHVLCLLPADRHATETDKRSQMLFHYDSDTSERKSPWKSQNQIPLLLGDFGDIEKFYLQSHQLELLLNVEPQLFLWFRAISHRVCVCIKLKLKFLLRNPIFPSGPHLEKEAKFHPKKSINLQN
jgi:hypothetical protein